MKPVVTFFKLILLLLAGSAAAVTLEQSIKLDKDPGKLYLIAPELFRDGSFAFASIDNSSDPVQREINVTLSIVGRNSSNLKCTFKLKTDSNAKIGLNSLRRLSEKKLLLVGYEEPQDGDRHASTISFDLQSCESTHFLSASVLPEIDQIITSSSSDEFTVFVPTLINSNSSLFCPNGRRRVILGGDHQYSDCFDIDLRWPDMKIGHIFYGDRYAVRGFDTNGTYKVLDFNTKDHPPKRPELISLSDATNQSQIFSSGDGLCYLATPGNDKWVHCMVFVVNQYSFVKIVTFDETVNIIAVSYSSFPEQELLLVTEKNVCGGPSECADVVVTRILQHDGSRKTYALKVECDGANRVAIGVERTMSKGAIALEYVCNYDNVLSFHTIDVSSLHGYNDLQF